jgi:hypothetical protein
MSMYTLVCAWMCMYCNDIHIYILIHTNTYVYIHIHTYTGAYSCRHKYIHIHTIQAYTYKYVQIYAYMHIGISYAHTDIYRCIHTYMNHTYTYRHMNNICISVQMHMCLYCACIYMHNTCIYKSVIPYEHIWTCRFTDVEMGKKECSWKVSLKASGQVRDSSGRRGWGKTRQGRGEARILENVDSRDRRAASWAQTGEAKDAPPGPVRQDEWEQDELPALEAAALCCARRTHQPERLAW